MNSQTVEIIRDRVAETTARELQRVWHGDATFALIPEKSELDDTGLREQFRLLPEDLRTGHFILLTSGSTGRPKLLVGCRKRSAALGLLLTKVQYAEGVRETIVVLPLSYSFAFINQWVWAKANNKKLVCTEGFSNPESLRVALSRAENAMLCLVGAQVPLLKRLFGNSVQFPSVSRLHFAGGPFPQDSVEYLEHVFPDTMIFNNYGCVEAMPRLTIRQARDADTAGNIGKPLPGIRLDSDARGRIRFQSPYGAVGCIENDRFQRIQEGEWVYSGDYGHRLDDGSWVLEGRANEVFKRYGEKISLTRLAESVRKHWHGELSFYREKDTNGENGCVLVLSPVPEKGDVQRILKQLRSDFPRPYWPLRLESVESLPLLSSGKVDVVGLSKSSESKAIHWYQRL